VKINYLQNASKACHREQIKYAEAGSIAEEVFTSIRTVAAFGLEKQGIARCVNVICIIYIYIYIVFNILIELM
jgi:hypothetical protein